MDPANKPNCRTNGRTETNERNEMNNKQAQNIELHLQILCI